MMQLKYFGYLLKKIFELEKPIIAAEILKKIFINYYNINIEEIELPLKEYPSVQKLFCRKLKKNARIIGDGIVSPVDGLIRQAGRIAEYTAMQVKGRQYDIRELIGTEKADDYKNGWYTNIYLAPYNYHRIHSPYKGFINELQYFPGRFYPVNNFTVNRVDKLFAVNERIISYIETDIGKIAVVKVAAFGVGDIKITFIPDDKYILLLYKNNFTKFEKSIKINKFDELGMFAFGSTVVLLFDKKIKAPE